MGYDQDQPKKPDQTLESLISEIDQLTLEYDTKRKISESLYSQITQLKMEEMEATRRFDEIAKTYEQVHARYAEATKILREASELSRSAFERWQLNHSSIMSMDIELRKATEELKEKKREEKRALKLRFAQLTNSKR
jgi:hypothetical protein